MILPDVQPGNDDVGWVATVGGSIAELSGCGALGPSLAEVLGLAPWASNSRTIASLPSKQAVRNGKPGVPCMSGSSMSAPASSALITPLTLLHRMDSINVLV